MYSVDDAVFRRFADAFISQTTCDIVRDHLIWLAHRTHYDIVPVSSMEKRLGVITVGISQYFYCACSNKDFKFVAVPFAPLGCDCGIAASSPNVIGSVWEGTPPKLTFSQPFLYYHDSSDINVGLDLLMQQMEDVVVGKGGDEGAKRAYREFLDHHLSVVDGIIAGKRNGIQAIRQDLIRDETEIEALELGRSEMRRKAADEKCIADELALISVLGRPYSIDFEQGVIIVRTHPITMTNIRNEDERWKLGVYDAVFDLVHKRVHVTEVSIVAPIPGYEYSHPHVSGGGVPCFGDAEGRANDALARGRIGEACAILHEVLSSYNPDGAYQPIDDENRYESCFENASTRECASCSDDHCPYAADAEERCREDHVWHDCVECSYGDCSYARSRSAMDECFEGSNVERCATECTTDGCYYRGNRAFERCHSDRLGTCEDCEYACPHRPDPEEEEEKDEGAEGSEGSGDGARGE